MISLSNTYAYLKGCHPLMSDIISIEYEQVSQIGTRFADESTRVQAVINQLEQQIQVLKQGGWIADAADAYYQEMDSDVMPAMLRLVQALSLASETMGQVASTLSNAEQEACGFFPKTD